CSDNAGGPHRRRVARYSRLAGGRFGVGSRAVSGDLGIAQLAQLGQRTLASSEEAIAQVTELVQRLSGIDITVLSEVRDGGYRFAGLETIPALPLVAGETTIPFESSLCSRVHLGQAPAVVPEMRGEPGPRDPWPKPR